MILLYEEACMCCRVKARKSLLVFEGRVEELFSLVGRVLTYVENFRIIVGGSYHCCHLPPHSYDLLSGLVVLRAPRSHRMVCKEGARIRGAKRRQKNLARTYNV